MAVILELLNALKKKNMAKKFKEKLVQLFFSKWSLGTVELFKLRTNKVMYHTKKKNYNVFSINLQPLYQVRYVYNTQLFLIIFSL